VPESLQELRNQLPSWPSSPDKPSLGATDVHVFRASLEPAGHVAARLGQLLSRDEYARADRFHFEIDRQHFIVARGYLRTILSRYIGIAPAGIRFSYADHGKPRLASPIGQTQPLHFNLTHSAGLALYAFTRVGEIGIDLEHIRPDFSGEDTARRFFSSTEVTCLSKLPESARHEAFFNCWTRKEAFIKAKGTGLSLPLDQFDVTVAPAEPAALLRTRWDESEAARWSLKAIDMGPAYVGAVAVGGHNWQLTCWEFDKERLL
jgi:4'-phosphopantetheinyl transferase